MLYNIITNDVIVGGKTDSIERYCYKLSAGLGVTCVLSLASN